MDTCCHHQTKQLKGYGPFKLVRCVDCGMIKNSLQQPLSSPKELYKDFYRNELPARFGFGLEYVIRIFRFFRAYKVTTVASHAKTILDIGSGRGFMLYFLKKYFGYTTAVGTQIAPNAADFSRNKLGLEIYDRDLLEIDFKDERFDLITIWHVLEHIQEPEKYIVYIQKLLRDKGLLLIEVPNFDSWGNRLTKKYWLGLDPKHHLWFYTPSSLIELVEKHGFQVKKVHTFSLEYSTFISTQSLVSAITNTDQIFFEWLQSPSLKFRIIPHLVLFLILAPFCLIINLSLYFSRYGEVLLIVAEKR